MEATKGGDRARRVMVLEEGGGARKDEEEEGRRVWISQGEGLVTAGK